MRINEKERRIISALQLRADTPYSQIARELRLREHGVRRAIQSLLEREIIRPHVVVDLTALGFTEYEVLFSFAPERQSSTEEYVAAVVESENVSWLAPTAGEFQYAMVLAARDVREVADFFSTLACRFGHVVCQKAMSARLGLILYRRKHLEPKRQKVDWVEVEHGRAPSVSIDLTDHRILYALAQNPGVAWRALARELELPYSTLLDRLGRLRSSGVIVAFVYLLNFTRYGMHMYRLLLAVKGVNPTLKHTLRAFCDAHPLVTSFTHAVGAWDFVVAAEAEQPDEIVRLTQALYQLCGHDLQSVKVLSRYWNLKWQMYPFMTYRAHLR